jgi:hypothetical protein
MPDPFASTQANITGPISKGATVTPSDSTDLATSGRALWVGTGGDVNLTTVDGSTFVMKNVPSGTMLPIRAARIRSTSTTATDIVVLW